MFNSLSYATKLVDAGVPREQAEVHAQVLQGVYEQEHEQYATKTDFIKITDEIAGLKTTINECKNQFSSFQSEIANVQSDITNLKSDITNLKSDITNLKSDIAHVQSDISTLQCDVSNIRSDISVLKNSNKYLLWIGGVMATMFVSMFGVNVSMLFTR
jgi:chromosome segregation ATPase